ncbi:MAG: hypothetical protein R2834_03725 [Rhodothermales bacterium]
MLFGALIAFVLALVALSTGHLLLAIAALIGSVGSLIFFVRSFIGIFLQSKSAIAYRTHFRLIVRSGRRRIRSQGLRQAQSARSLAGLDHELARRADITWN